MSFRCLLMCTLLLVGCTPSFMALRSNQDSAIEELRMEVADLKHALHAAEVETKILEERLEASEGTTVPMKSDEVAELQRNMIALERSIDKINTDIRSLMHFTSQTTTTLSQYRDHILGIDHRLDEVSKLRSTLSDLSHKAKSPSIPTYRVKSGDSLEKIAQKYQVTIAAIKQKNGLTSDKILVGQELLIPASAPK